MRRDVFKNSRLLKNARLETRVSSSRKREKISISHAGGVCESKSLVDTFPYIYIRKTEDTKFNNLARYGERSMTRFFVKAGAFDKCNKGELARSIFPGVTWRQQPRRRYRQRVPSRGSVQRKTVVRRVVSHRRKRRRRELSRELASSESRVIRRQPRFAYPRSCRALTGGTTFISDVPMTLQRELRI